MNFEQCLHEYRDIVYEKGYDVDFFTGIQNAIFYENREPQEIAEMIRTEMKDEDLSERWKKKVTLFFEDGVCFPYMNTILQAMREQMTQSEELVKKAKTTNNISEKITLLSQALYFDGSNGTASEELIETLFNILDVDRDRFISVAENIQDYFIWGDYLNFMDELLLRKEITLLKHLTKLSKHKDELFIKTYLLNLESFEVGYEYYINHRQIIEKIMNEKEGQLFREGKILKEYYRYGDIINEYLLKEHSPFSRIMKETDEGNDILKHNNYREFLEIASYIKSHPNVEKPTPGMMIFAAMFISYWYEIFDEPFPLIETLVEMDDQDEMDDEDKEDQDEMDDEDEEVQDKMEYDNERIPRSKRPYPSEYYESLKRPRFN